MIKNMEEREVLLIDEINRMRKEVEEIIYKEMEDFKIDIIIGEGNEES